RPVRLRLHPGLYRQLLPPPDTEQQRQENDRQLDEFAAGLEKVHRLAESGEEEDLDEPLRHLLSLYGGLVQDEPFLAASVGCFLGSDSFSVACYPGGVVVTRQVRPGFSALPSSSLAELDGESTETTEDDTASLTRRVTLTEHLQGVAAWVGRFSQG